MFACQLSQALQQAGHEVHLLVLFGKDPHILPWNKKTFHLGANEKKRWFDFSGYRRLARIVRSGEYDIVQANAGDTLKYAVFSRMLYGWHSFIVFRNANKISDFINSFPKKLIHSFLMRQVDHVASVSEACRIDFIKLFPFLREESTTLPIGVNIDEADFSKGKGKFINENPVLIQVGGFVPEKNHAGMLRIFQQVLVEKPAAELRLAGEGRLMSTVRQQAEQMGIASRVRFLGNRKDIFDLMHECDLLVMPSLIEGLPGVILEAFECRLPVVAYDVGGIHEVVKDGITGRLLKKNDETGFANAVLQILNSDNEIIADNAQQLVRNEYDNKRIASKFIETYHQLLKKTTV